MPNIKSSTDYEIIITTYLHTAVKQVNQFTLPKMAEAT